MPTAGEALQQARQLLAGGQLAAAEEIYRRLVQSVPQAAEAWGDLGVLHLQAKRPEAAIESLRRAASLDPLMPAYHSNLGAAHRMMRRFDLAADSFQRAVAIGPPTAELCNNLGLARKDAGQNEAALQAFDEALRLRPDYANGHFNRGNLLLAMGQLHEAIAEYQVAIQLNPDDAGAYCSLGVAHYDLGQMDAALAAYARALELQADYCEVRRNRALVWLSRGEYSRGWPEYEWRLRCDDFAPCSFEQPRWDGSPLDGRTLLVYAEQGLGDTLQFIRYVPLVEKSAEKSGGRVWMQLQPHASLRRVLEQSGFGRWLVAGEALPHFDVHCSLLSLAGLLADLGGKPYWGGPYLNADERLAARWQERLRAISGFKVGIVWAGNPDHPHDRYRSVRLREFAPLADVPGVRLLSLQKGPGCPQLAEVAGEFEVITLGDDVDETSGPFMDTAAVMKHLDLVIAADTAVAHLAGGQGVNVWVPLQLTPDWRWLNQGQDTPWYPSMRLFRQSQFNDWTPVFERMADALRELQAR